MTIKVHLHTRKPKNKEIVHTPAEFTRIPVVGEYISLPSSDEYYYKVLVVVHIPLIGKKRRCPTEYDAEVYALGFKVKEVYKASGFFPTNFIQAQFDSLDTNSSDSF
jgi:hypothetical protein